MDHFESSFHRKFRGLVCYVLLELALGSLRFQNSPCLWSLPFRIRQKNSAVWEVISYRQEIHPGESSNSCSPLGTFSSARGLD